MTEALAFYAAVCSDAGYIRKSNGDNFSLLGQILPEREDGGRYLKRSAVAQEGVIAVFGGMGEPRDGAPAAREAAQVLQRFQDRLLTLSKDGLTQYVRAANQALCESAEAAGRRMDTTVAAAAIRDGLCMAGNVGDSRIYYLSEGEFIRLSQDHTVISQLLKAGTVTEEAAKTDRRRHQLTQYLGIPENAAQLRPHVTESFQLYPGDRLLLCSDGVTDVLPDETLRGLLSQGTSCEKIAEEIVDAALMAGNDDNVTALVVKVGKLRPKAKGGSHSSELSASAGFAGFAGSAGSAVSVGSADRSEPAEPEASLPAELESPPRRTAASGGKAQKSPQKNTVPQGSDTLQNTLLIAGGVIGFLLGVVTALVI